MSASSPQASDSCPESTALLYTTALQWGGGRIVLNHWHACSGHSGRCIAGNNGIVKAASVAKEINGGTSRPQRPRATCVRCTAMCSVAFIGKYKRNRQRTSNTVTKARKGDPEPLNEPDDGRQTTRSANSWQLNSQAQGSATRLVLQRQSDVTEVKRQAVQRGSAFQRSKCSNTHVADCIGPEIQVQVAESGGILQGRERLGAAVPDVIRPQIERQCVKGRRIPGVASPARHGLRSDSRGGRGSGSAAHGPPSESRAPPPVRLQCCSSEGPGRDAAGMGRLSMRRALHARVPNSVVVEAGSQRVPRGHMFERRSRVKARRAGASFSAARPWAPMGPT